MSHTEKIVSELNGVVGEAQQGSGPSVDPRLEPDLSIPLVVDVDGTLLKTDLLHEAALRLLATDAFQVFRIPFWLLGGKAKLKRELAERVPLDSHVPLRPEVLELIRKAKAAGRKVVLASASDRAYVEALARRVGDIDLVYATDGQTNLAGAAKARTLVQAFGKRGFDYVGDDAVDLEVWREARRALLVSKSAGLERAVKAEFPDVTVVARSGSLVKPLLKAMRPHQWAKNLLIFMPMLLAHSYDLGSILSAFIALMAFSFAASSAYLLNDLLDLPSDRRHATKSRRPLAAGAARLDHAVLLSAGLTVAALGLALQLNTAFLALLCLYFALTVAYSLVLKRKMLVDVVVLGGLYTLRVLAGAAAVNAPESKWLLLFCFFLFLGLALAKRIAELQAKEPGQEAPAGRGYRIEDLRMLLPLGAGAAFGAPLVMGLYIASPEVLVRYSAPSLLWLVCPILLYWLSRVLMLANRGHLHEDPVVFALTDRTSWICCACIVGLMLAAR